LPVAAVGLACVALVILGYYSLRLVRAQELADAEASAAEQTIDNLNGELAQARASADARQRELAQVVGDLERTKKTLAGAQEKLDELSAERADLDAAMRDFKAIAARFQRLVDGGRLKVSFRRGRMVVDLPAQVLFASGSAELSKEGKKSLRAVARILRKVKGKRFIVAGHTDNVKIRRNPLFSSNWALSAARAVTVTEALVRFGIRPTNLVAAGYGPHDPVASNRKASGKQLNRRIEIILEPRLRELPDRLEDKL
jgi:chemotaxis protein MotB